MKSDKFLKLNLFFNDTTLNGTRIYVTTISKNADMVRKNVYIYLKLPILINDIFKVEGKKYYLKKLISVTADGYKYEVKREDRYGMTDIDINRLTKGKQIKVIGHYE